MAILLKEDASQNQNPESGGTVVAAYEAAIIGQGCPASDCSGTVVYNPQRLVATIECSAKPGEHWRMATGAEVANQAEARGVIKSL